MYRLFFFLFLCCCTKTFAQQRFQFSQTKMGSPFHLVFYAPDSAKANTVATAAYHFVDSLNAIFSDYLDESELNALSKTAGSGKSVPLSPLLFDVLARSKQAVRSSKGAFAVTIGPLSRLWRTARKTKTFPTKEAILAAKQKAGNSNLHLDFATKSAKLSVPGMQLDLGGIAKGYAAQAVINFLQTQGITSALADAGGDMACSNPPPGKKGWTVGINVPGKEDELLSETIILSNCAVATSGDVYQYMEHEGKRYSHIIDPRTGYGVLFQRNVTVLAPDGATADWLATACSILPLSQCKKLVKRFGAQLLITQWKDNKVTYFLSEGMQRMLKD